MSYDIYLLDPTTLDCVEVERFTEGGTYPLGGSTKACLNVTYNYQQVFYVLDWSLKELDGKTAAETLPDLERLADKLPDRPYFDLDPNTGHKVYDYWAPTPGNAGRAIHTLRKWAMAHPSAIWKVE